MNEHIMQISSRMRELRSILDISADEVAKKVGVELSLYEKYENGQEDIPIGVLYGVAGVLEVDPTVLLTGEDPRMNDYTVTRRDKGISIERYKGYKFSSLAYNFVNRQMEPMIVTIVPGIHPELVTHGGHEFNYILSGKVRVTISNKSVILNEGDSIYFNPSLPHGQSAVDGEARFLTVINEL